MITKISHSIAIKSLHEEKCLHDHVSAGEVSHELNTDICPFDTPNLLVVAGRGRARNPDADRFLWSIAQLASVGPGLLELRACRGHRAAARPSVLGFVLWSCRLASG